MVRLRAHKPELLRLVAAEAERTDAVQAPRQPHVDAGQVPIDDRGSTSNSASNRDRTGRTSYSHYGAGHPDANPPEPMPAPAVG